VRSVGPRLAQADVPVIEIKTPFTVEIHPRCALELRLRILRAGNILAAREGGDGESHNGALHDWIIDVTPKLRQPILQGWKNR
jgi:hypothetical protein